jgi:hypothetical protein
MLTLYLILVIPTSIWVAADAYGRRPPAEIAWWGWLLGCLGLWIVFFPWYLGVRGRAPHWPKGTPAPPGWYSDPNGQGKRWWNGQQWSDPPPSA